VILTDPSRLWFSAHRLYVRGSRVLPRIIKAYLFVVFRAVLPPEAVQEGPVSLGHRGMNVVVHPNVKFGSNVHLWHGVTLAVSAPPGSSRAIRIGDDVTIGAGTVVVSRETEDLEIPAGTRIGANGLVVRSLPCPGTYVSAPSKLVTRVEGRAADATER